MAYCDYFHCHLCDAKAFYDASIDWNNYPEIAVVALCGECSKTHEITVKKKDTPMTTTTERLAMALENIAAIENQAYGDAWQEIELARLYANEALAAYRAGALADGSGEQECNGDIYVPGTWCCAKCKFTLQQMNMNANTGTVTARDQPGDKCPNCDSPLWRVTWKQQAKEMLARAEEQMLRANDLQKELDALRATASPTAGLTERPNLVDAARSTSDPIEQMRKVCEVARENDCLISRTWVNGWADAWEKERAGLTERREDEEVAVVTVYQHAQLGPTPMDVRWLKEMPVGHHKLYASPAPSPCRESEGDVAEWKVRDEAIDLLENYLTSLHPEMDEELYSRVEDAISGLRKAALRARPEQEGGV